VIVGSVLTGTLSCQPDKGHTIGTGFTATCTFTITGIK
jgi:hypothetical protein